MLLKDAARSFAEQLPSLLAPTAKPLGSRTAAAWQRDGVADTAIAIGAEDNEGPDRSSAKSSAAQTVALQVSSTVKARFGVDPDKYLDHGSVVIAQPSPVATNTSNPSVMIAAGLLAKKAVEKGLTVPPWVKTSLASWLAASSRTTTKKPACFRISTSTSCASTLSVMAAQHASATAAPLPSDVSKSIED